MLAFKLIPFNLNTGQDIKSVNTVCLSTFSTQIAILLQCVTQCRCMMPVFLKDEIGFCFLVKVSSSVLRALQFPPEGWLRMGLNNGSITWLTIRPSGRVALRTLGDAGFMPPDKLTRT